MGRIRWNEQETIHGDLLAIQKIQNKMVRLLNGKSLADKISTKTLLKKLKMLSVNKTTTTTSSSLDMGTLYLYANAALQLTHTYNTRL